MKYNAATRSFLIDQQSLEQVAFSIPYIIMQIRIAAGLPLDKYESDGTLTPADRAMHGVLKIADRLGIEVGALWGHELDLSQDGVYQIF